MHKILNRANSRQGRDRVPAADVIAKTKTVETSASPVSPGINLASGLLENSDLKQPRRSIDFLISLAGQAAFVILLILIPLCYTQAFNLPDLEKTILVAPPPPPPPPPREVRVLVKPKVSLFDNGKLVAPRVIPKQVAILKEAPEPTGNAGVSGGVLGGVPGGSLGGVLGGILSSRNVPVPPPPPRPVKSNGPVRVGGRVQAPRLVRRVNPIYPQLAKATRTQGAVVLDCIIDEQGNVTQIRLISGHPLLVQAALAAVQQWKYQPTLLNGNPVSVEMRVTVSFVLGTD